MQGLQPPPLKICVRDRVKVVTYFTFQENPLRGLGAEGGSKSPSPIHLAHGLYTTACSILYKP